MKTLVALTGAGISAPSGIPTFQGRPELRESLTMEAWREDPRNFWQLMQALYTEFSCAKPNPAHLAVARAGIPVITQNVDQLHQAAGSKDVLELHGNIQDSYCPGCARRLATTEAFVLRYLCPDCGGWLKPEVVLFTEPVKEMEKAMALAAQARVFLVVGSSLTVYPAAHLPEIAVQNGAKLVVINDDAEIKVPEFFGET